MWRGGHRQALLAGALNQCEETSLDGAAARTCGQVCARTGISDVFDTSVAVGAADFARHSDKVVATSDPGDIAALVQAVGAPAGIAVALRRLLGLRLGLR